jgi:ParB/RepB/Spo0J family partition protein
VTLAAVRPALREIPLALIDEPALPSRSKMDDAKMDELIADMRANGFTSAMVLAIVGERFEVIAGHRRWHAAHRAGIVAVPALVYPSKDPSLRRIQHGENKRREDLNPADEAIWFQQLYDEHPEDGTDGVAAQVGESRAYVEGRLLLFQGCGDVFQALADGKIGIGVAQELNRCDNDVYRRSLLDQAIRHGATKAIVSGWIAEYKRTIAPAIADVDLAHPATSAGPASLPDYFTCRLCDSTENPAYMRPVNMHDYCIKAQLEPALRWLRNRGDFVEWPRTLDAARELAARLIERFPELVPE